MEVPKQLTERLSETHSSAEQTAVQKSLERSLAMQEERFLLFKQKLKKEVDERDYQSESELSNLSLHDKTMDDLERERSDEAFSKMSLKKQSNGTIDISAIVKKQ